ncbi:MAG: NUDIX domain-containing protein [Gammaproteobacteria bacterium]|nr:NUDIX domain-containing protein [Gammaproteobacteria bacterium]MCK5262341.1 NUDIX domain-containing protein [Gammaproteobacteria bacterium]
MKSEVHQKQKSPANKRPFIGVAVLLWKGDCLLLGQRIGSHGEHDWQFPGGHLEAGESALECASREVLEETGLELDSARHAGFSNEMFAAGERDYVTLFVTAAHLAGEPCVMEPDKCLSWQWFPYNLLPSPLFLPITNFLKQEPDLSVYRVDLDIRLSEQK